MSAAFDPLRTLGRRCRKLRISDKWRAEALESLPFLRGQSFVRKPYKAYAPHWDHDHCAVCGVKLMEAGAEGQHDDVVHEGYGTTSDYQHGEDYDWVCPACFAASKDIMGWSNVSVS